MAINQLIAQGIAPIGRDLPQVANMLHQKRQQESANALADRGMAVNEQNASAANMNALSTQARLKQADEAAKQERTMAWAANAVQAVRQNPALIPQFIAEGKQKGILRPETPDQATPEQIETFAMQLGIAPAPQKFTTQTGPRGSVLKIDPRTGEPTQVVGPDNSQPSSGSISRYATLSPDEVAAAGLPPGTSAQRDVNTGKIDLLSKRDTTGGLSQKDQTTAKLKLNTVSLARQQLNKIREAFNEGKKGFNAFGPGQGLLPTQQGKIFDARVNQMRSTLTALTRVPGVGAMSDYETKLDQSKFPSRTSYESVTEDTLKNLDDQLSLIENGYKGLLSGQPQESTPPTPPASSPSIDDLLKKYGGS